VTPGDQAARHHPPTIVSSGCCSAGAGACGWASSRRQAS
jgi:hypothetical protein